MALVTNELHRVLKNQLQYPGLRSVNIICSYIKKGGVEKLLSFFRELERLNVPVRIITTFQLGISDLEAIKELALLQRTEVYIFSPTRPTFHAKGWLFEYACQDYDTAIVGSANMTDSALTSGIEWNILVRRSEHGNASQVIEDFKETFDSYWDGSKDGFETSLIEFNPKSEDFKSVLAMIQRDLPVDDALMARAPQHMQAR